MRLFNTPLYIHCLVHHQSMLDIYIIQSDPCTFPLQAETQSQLTPIVITLSPGDLLYVPAAWSHEVQSVPDSPTSFVFSVNKFYPTSIFQCARRGSGWAVARCKLWNYKLNRGGCIT